jgi:hypothetical protein
VEFLENSSLIVWFAVLQDPLNNPAAVRMSSKDVDLAPEGIDDELYVFSRYTLDSLLNNMVSILILDTLENISLQLFNELSLLVR